MAEPIFGDDPEPSDRLPAGLLYVPVRPGPEGARAARMFRTPLGERTAVGFTSAGRLAGTLGPEQAWTRLSEPALRALTAPLGVTTITVDPQFTAPAVREEQDQHTGHGWDPQILGVLRVTGAVALVDALITWIH